jgi:hypothetical protein
MTPEQINAAVAEKVAQATEQLIAAIESLHEAEDAISADEGATEEQQDDVIDSFDNLHYAKNEAVKAVAEYRLALLKSVGVDVGEAEGR